MKKIANEFKEFAMRGNVMDLAVGVVIGGAFGKITTSLVQDIIMPPLGLILGKVDFANLFIDFSKQDFKTLAEAKEAGVVTINYGLFLTSVLDFLIIAFAIFIVIRYMNKLKRKEEGVEEKAPTTKPCPFCNSTISIKATRCPNCTSELVGQNI